MQSTVRPLLVVRSVTNAIRGQKLLEQHGIKAQIQRNAIATLNQGCGYAICINGDVHTAVAILKQANIHVVQIIGGDGCDLL